MVRCEAKAWMATDRTVKVQPVAVFQALSHASLFLSHDDLLKAIDCIHDSHRMASQSFEMSGESI